LYLKIESCGICLRVMHTHGLQERAFFIYQLTFLAFSSRMTGQYLETGHSYCPIRDTANPVVGRNNLIQSIPQQKETAFYSSNDNIIKTNNVCLCCRFFKSRIHLIRTIKSKIRLSGHIAHIKNQSHYRPGVTQRVPGRGFQEVTFP